MFTFSSYTKWGKSQPSLLPRPAFQSFGEPFGSPVRSVISHQAFRSELG
jgi:hypothetical protein